MWHQKERSRSECLGKILVKDKVKCMEMKLPLKFITDLCTSFPKQLVRKAIDLRTESFLNQETQLEQLLLKIARIKMMFLNK